jgi:ferric enterobactin receptor
MKKLLLVTLLIGFGYSAFAQQAQTQKTLRKTNIDHFFTCSLDLMLDTLSTNYHLNIVYERDSLVKFDVAEHFFNESLKFILEKVCVANKLHYWIESDGTIYILQNTDDLARLKSINRLRQTKLVATNNTLVLETPKVPPMHFLFTISGKVVDISTGESLPSASLRIRNTTLTATTNTDGNFTIFNVPSDTCVIEVTYSGYQDDYFRLSPKNINDNLVLSMYKALNTLNEVSIIGKKNGIMSTDTKKVGVLQLSPANLDKLPSIGEKDIMRAFQLMPGVGATNESSSGAYVRGGTPDQNLVVFDGFTIYQVDHLYGFFSAFNSNALKDVQLYKGGFSSMYGGRLSSVTEINGKDGDRNGFNMGIDLSLLSVNAFVEGPIGDNSSLLVTFRRSYQGPLYNKIFQQFNTSTVSGGGPGGGPGRGGFGESTIPSSHFYDADLRYNYHIDKNNIIVLSAYNGEDITDNSRVLDIPSFISSSGNLNITDYTKYGNLGSSLKWFRQWNTKLHSNTYLTYSSYFNDRNRSTAGDQEDSEGNLQGFERGTNETNNLQEIGVKSEWEWMASNQLKFLYGGFATHQNINYDYVQNDTTSLISQHNKAYLGGGYAELEYDPNDKLHLQPGLRTTWFEPTGKLYLEPRFSASYLLNSNFTLKAATGQFDQYINEVTREDIENGNRNFWVLSNNSNIPVSQAQHYMGGVSWENNLFLIDVEGYYKTLEDITQYTIRQTGFNASNGTQNINQDFYTGSGNAKGIEILLQKKLGRYTGWISYTLADAEDKFAVYGNNYFPADQDIRHEFKTVNLYHLGRWNFSGVFIFSTGHPYTAPVSVYTVTGADGNAVTGYNISGKNALRYPDYNRLDLSATYDLIKINGNKIGSIGLSLFNVYNHTNIWYKEFQVENYEVVTTNVNYLGFTPNLTLSLRWK